MLKTASRCDLWLLSFSVAHDGPKWALSPRGPPMGLIGIKLETAPFSTKARRMLKTASRYDLWLLSFSVAHDGPKRALSPRKPAMGRIVIKL